MKDEISLDLDWLWKWNFGWDDWAISSTGKECRYPCLDQTLIEEVSSIPIEEICDFELKWGIGEKKILREIAISFGLKYAPYYEKRAI